MNEITLEVSLAGFGKDPRGKKLRDTSTKKIIGRIVDVEGLEISKVILDTGTSILRKDYHLYEMVDEEDY